MLVMNLNFSEMDENKLISEFEILENLKEYIEDNNLEDLPIILIPEINRSFSDAGAIFEISGFDLVFNKYIYYFSDIYMDLDKTIENIKEKSKGELFFYEHESMRKIKFKYHLDNNFKCYCEDGIYSESIGHAEYVDAGYFLNMIKNLKNNFNFNLKKYYPLIYKKYLND